MKVEITIKHDGKKFKKLDGRGYIVFVVGADLTSVLSEGMNTSERYTLLSAQQHFLLHEVLKPMTTGDPK